MKKLNLWLAVFVALVIMVGSGAALVASKGALAPSVEDEVDENIILVPTIGEDTHELLPAGVAVNSVAGDDDDVEIRAGGISAAPPDLGQPVDLSLVQFRVLWQGGQAASHRGR